MEFIKKTEVTSKRKKTKVAADSIPPPTVDVRAETLRRGLLAFVTALIVARPLVLGEDPGLKDPLSSASGLLLSMLWFVAAVAYAAWRAWFRQETGARCPVEWGLAGVVVLVFVSALAGARYQHPAFLIAWEWVVLLLAFGLVRRLTRSSADCRCLLAAVLATGVSLSAHAVYQSTYEMRQHRQLADDPQQLRETGTKLFGPMEPDDPRLENLKQRLLMDHVFATYAHPNAFAGYLALLVPAAVGWVLAAWQAVRKGVATKTGWQVLLTAGCALLLILALWLTHSRGAILGVMMVGLAAFFVRPKANGAGRKDLLLGVAVLLFLTFSWLLFPSVFAKAWRSIGLRTDYWTATWAMIGDHPWLGVGPGNFGRHYPRYMAATAFEKIQDPHNFVLEIWATCGLFALLALLATLGVLFWQAWSVVRSPWSVAKEQQPTDYGLRTTDYGLSPRLDFYFAGMAGLIVGFLIRAGDLSADDLLPEGVLSGVRSLIWFAAFALLERLPWSGRTMTIALSAGVAALLLNLGISGGIALPSVAQPLWVMAALALNSGWSAAPGAGRVTTATAPRTWLYWSLPLPLLAGLGLVYLLLVFSPVTACQSALAKARRDYGDDPGWEGWRNRFLPDWEARVQRGTAAEKVEESRKASRFLIDHILLPLQKAALADPGDSTPPLELAFWYGEEGKILQSRSKPYEVALNRLRQARRLDPANKEVYLVEYRLQRMMAQQFPDREKTYRTQAAWALKAAVELDPTEARLHYELAEAWFLAGDRVKGRDQAALAQALDEQATVAERHLTDPQREQIRKWLSLAANG